MHLVRMLWNTLVLTYTGAAFLVRSGVVLGAGLLFLVCVVGLAVMGGVFAVLGLAILSIDTPFQPFLNAHSNAITWMGIIGGAIFALRHGYKHYRLHNPKAADVHGSAAFMDRRAVAALTRGEGLIIGREIKPSGKPDSLLRDNGPAHLLTLPPPDLARASAPSFRTCSPPSAPSSASTPKARMPA
jgi:hypothetical protein